MVAGLGAGDRALATGGPLQREAERELPAQRPPPLPVRPQLGCGKGRRARLGGRGSSHGWGGIGALGQILGFFQAYTEATVSHMGTRVAGGVGRTGGQFSACLKPEKGLPAERARAPSQAKTPRLKLSSECLSRGSGGQETHEKEAFLCGARARGSRGPVPPQT